MGQPGKKGPQNIHLDFSRGQDKSLAPGRNGLFKSPSLGSLQVQSVGGLSGLIPAPDLAQDPFSPRGEVRTACPWSPSAQSQVPSGPSCPPWPQSLRRNYSGGHH